MIGKIITPESATVSVLIPQELIGKKVKVIAYKIEDEAMILEDLMIEQIAEEQNIEIPEWQQKLVLEAQKEAEENPQSLKSWDEVLRNLRTKKN